MSAELVVTRGYGNGTVVGTIANVVVRGFLPSISSSDYVQIVSHDGELNRTVAESQNLNRTVSHTGKLS